MEPKKQLVGIVIKADGTVPFDDDCPEEHRAMVIAHLFDQGHALTAVPNTRHVKITHWNKAKA